MTIRTEKQAAIAEAIRRSPSLSDTAIAQQTGSSRNLVRRLRARMNPLPNDAAAASAPAPPRDVPWSKALDPVFAPDGIADELEGYVEELVGLAGRLDRRLAEIEMHARGHFVRNDRHRLIRELYNVARRIQTELVPAGACPFCERGCARCAGGGWAPAGLVDVVASLEDRNSRRRWWRVHRIEVPF